MTPSVRRRAALAVASVALALGLAGCGLRTEQPAADPSGATTAGAGAPVVSGDAPGAGSTSTSSTVIGEDAIGTVEDALDSATTVADQVEQEIAQDEEG